MTGLPAINLGVMPAGFVVDVLFAPSISVQRICVAADLSSKKRLLELLAELLAGAFPHLVAQAVLVRLIERERLGSTGIGHGVALPHARVADIDHAIGAFVQLRQPISFDALDDCPVDLVFALLAPEGECDLHVRQLAGLATLFSDPDQRALLRQSSNPETLLSMFDSWWLRVPPL